MSDTLYLQIEKNIQAQHPHVYLQDIAKLSCSNTRILNRLRVLPVANLSPEQPGRYVFSAMDLIALIQKKEPSLQISHIGEPTFIISYFRESAPCFLWRLCKIAFVCLTTFLGASFSIMTFNQDVDVSGLFQKLYTLVTGQPSNGFTILEITYSLGIGLGVLIFFNHFGKNKLSSDPTPMQVQMRLYEDDVNTTILEDVSRKQETP